jgi:hypothetical protein
VASGTQVETNIIMSKSNTHFKPCDLAFELCAEDSESINAFCQAAYEYLIKQSPPKYASLDSVKATVLSRLEVFFREYIDFSFNKTSTTKGLLFQLLVSADEGRKLYLIHDIISLFGFGENNPSTKIHSNHLSTLLTQASPRNIENWEGLNLTTFEILSKTTVGSLDSGKKFTIYDTSSGPLMIADTDDTTGLSHLIDTAFSIRNPLLLAIDGSISVHKNCDTAVAHNAKWLLLDNQETLTGYVSALSRFMARMELIDHRPYTTAELHLHKATLLGKNKDRRQEKTRKSIFDKYIPKIKRLLRFR